ncbi:MAG: hypothetical protein KIT16_18020 [Rhodospirillaceae bacterium]|nr:hypothetical protein [Rhodospirillaceae bacterium]
MKHRIFAIAAAASFAIGLGAPAFAPAYAGTGNPKATTKSKDGKPSAQRSVRDPGTPESGGAGRLDTGKVIFF